MISCESIGYYSQAAQGHLGLILQRQNIEELISNGNIPEDLRQKFKDIESIKNFAKVNLGLPVGDNYSSYVDVNRDYLVWNVFAAPEFSTEPSTWCYPFAGCVSYRGYFSKDQALRYAKKLENQGLDVYTGGAAAYSTLGWFDDPITNTVVDRSSNQLARLIFHELAHQVVYIPGDTTFNESFATVVENEGLRRWSSSLGQTDIFDGINSRQFQRQQFVDLVTNYRDKLSILYEDDLPDTSKRRKKQELQNKLRQEFFLLTEEWGNGGGYESWFANSLNNAQLSTVTSYNDLVPNFEKLLKQSGDDLEVFYSSVAELAKLNETLRKDKLQ
tara:strand:+ start:1474 stop:2463 length:990 start_codon:yes stop_codon:yes gene_type:complete